MKANIIFGQLTDATGFNAKSYTAESVENKVKVFGTWEFADKKAARRFLYKSLQQLRKKKGLGEPPEEMKFIMDGNSFDTTNSQMEDKTTGNAWLDTEDGKTFLIFRKEMPEKKTEKDAEPKDETETTVIEDPAPTVEVATTEQPAVAPEPEPMKLLPAPVETLDENIDALFNALDDSAEKNDTPTDSAAKKKTRAKKNKKAVVAA